MQKRCSTCIIAADYPGVSLDKDGMCNICKSYKHTHIKKRPLKELEEIFTSVKGKHEYDCAVAFSGGKDSTYALYLLKEKYNLKILAITGEDFIASPQAWENRFTTTKKLGVDHIIIRANWQLFRKVYAHALKRSGLRPRTINLIHNLLHEKAIYHALQTHDIPILITGNSQDELELFKEWEEKLDFTSTGNHSYDYWDNWRNAYMKVLEEILPKDMHKDIKDIVWNKPKKHDPATKTTHIPLFLYEPFDVAKNIQIIQEKLDWKMPTDVGGTETDSAGLQFDVLVYKKLHGDEAYAAEVSKLIRNGTITRAIAMKAMEYTDKTIIDTFFNDFHLSWDDLHPETCPPYLSKWLGFFMPIR